MNKDAIRFSASFYKHLSPRISSLPQILNQARTTDLIVLTFSTSSQPLPCFYIFPLSLCFSPPRATCISSSPCFTYPIHLLKFSCSWVYGELSIKSMTAVMLLEVPCTGGWIGSRQKGSHMNSSSCTLRDY